MAIDAVDVSEEGYIYALTSSGTIYGKSTVILDGYGSIVKEAPFGGGDIVVDDKSNSVWIVGADIKRLNKDLTLQFSIDPIEWCAVSVDFDTNGDAWVAEREHSDVSRSKNRLLKISPNGEIIQSIDLDSSPSCLSVDRKDDGIWVSTSGELYKFTSNGKKILEIASGRGFSVKVDNSDRSAWLAGRGDVRHYTKDGTLISSISVFSANQAYAAIQSWEPTPVSTAVPTSTPVETPTHVPSPFASILPFYIIGAAAVIVIILIAGIGISRKGKRGESKKQPPAEPPKPKSAKQEPIIKKEAPPPISESITIERAIYDPCKRDFIEGRLPRMKEWIERHDPGAYWFAVSIQNNTDKAIDEWGVDLEFSSALKIKDAKIEGIEIEIPHETHLGLFKISVPKEYGIVIPQKGAQRVYFKLRADKPKTTYEISGVFKSEITGDVPIRTKEFKYLCDTGVSAEAVKVELKKTFSEKEAARLALSFKTVQELDRMCDREAKTDEYMDKLLVLKNYTEGFSDTFTKKVDEFSRFMVQEQGEYLEPEYKGKVRRFCTNLVDVWISEFLKG